MTSSFTLFETPVRRCGLVWGEAGLLGLQLPEGSDVRTRERVGRRHPGAEEAPAPPLVVSAIAHIQALLAGAADDLRSLVLDMSAVPAFHRRVYERARFIPPGTTVTYGEIARDLGEPSAARAVGQALGRNPFAIIVPCHRVVAAKGATGGFSAHGGVDTKARLLALEGVRLVRQPSLFAQL